jgi:hypothetical protein
MAEENDEYDFDTLLEAEPEPDMEEELEVAPEAPRKQRRNRLQRSNAKRVVRMLRKPAPHVCHDPKQSNTRLKRKIANLNPNQNPNA